MTPQRNPPKAVRAKGKPPIATANEKIQAVDWAAFLAGISWGKTVLEYGPNRTIFVQGDPADSVWYLQQIGRASFRESDWSSDVCSSDLIGQHSSQESRGAKPFWNMARTAQSSCREILRIPCGISNRSEERRLGKVTGVQTCALPI